MQNNQQKIDQLTKQYPILERVPKEERLKVFQKSRKSPLVWGSLILYIVLWLYFFGWELIEISDNMPSYGRANRGEFFVYMFREGFFPILLPFMIFLFIFMQIQKHVLKKVVEKKYNKTSS